MIGGGEFKGSEHRGPGDGGRVAHVDWLGTRDRGSVADERDRKSRHPDCRRRGHVGLYGKVDVGRHQGRCNQGTDYAIAGATDGIAGESADSTGLVRNLDGVWRDERGLTGLLEWLQFGRLKGRWRYRIRDYFTRGGFCAELGQRGRSGGWQGVLVVVDLVRGAGGLWKQGRFGVVPGHQREDVHDEQDDGNRERPRQPARADTHAPESIGKARHLQSV